MLNVLKLAMLAAYVIIMNVLTLSGAALVYTLLADEIPNSQALTVAYYLGFVYWLNSIRNKEQ